MFKKSILAILLSSFFLLAPVSMATTVLSDDFNDNLKGDMWELFCIDEENSCLEETSQHLELRATGVGHEGGGYVSEGWRLLPSQNFSLKIDFSHSLVTNGWSEIIVFLSNRDNMFWANHLIFCASSHERQKYFYFELKENYAQMDEAWFNRVSDSGSLYISYDYNLDELYLSNTGYGSSEALKTISGLIRGRWSGEPIKIAIGASSENEFVDENELFLDNFIIEGDISQCTYSLAGDYNNDCKLDMLDFAEFASNWLTDCDASPDDSSCVSDPKWQSEPPMLAAREQFAGGVIDGKIYVFGGKDNSDDNLNSTEVFDPATGMWTQLAPNNYNKEGVEELTSAVVNGKLYVFGAWGGIGPSGNWGNINFNEMYDPATGTWKTLAPKPTLVGGAGATVYNGEIFVFGGSYDYEGIPQRIYYTVVEAYNPATNTWRSVTNMPRLTHAPAIATVGAKAYLFGGVAPNTYPFQVFDDVYSYDFQTGDWKTTGYASMPTAKGFGFPSTAPVVNGKVYLIGGGNEGGISNTVDVYDPSTNSWAKCASLPLPVDCHLAVSIDEEIYVLGGYNEDYCLNCSKAEVFSLSTPCSTRSIADFNADSIVNFADFGEFASNWLVDCSSNPDSSSCIFDPKWQSEPPMLTARDQFAGGVINGKIYIFGGNGNPDGVDLKSTEVFDPSAAVGNAWTRLADNNHNDDWGVEELTGAVVDNILYVFGAWGKLEASGNHGTINFNEKYDPATNSWTPLAKKLTPVSVAPSAVYNGKIYIFGGTYENEGLTNPIRYDVVECYDVATNSWQQETKIPKLLRMATVAVVGNKAYLIGGLDTNTNEKNTDILIYNFDTGVWQQNILTAMPNDRARAFTHSSAAPVVGSKIYLVGGTEGNIESYFASKKVDIYDTATDSWRKVKDLPLPIDNHLSVIVGNKLYILGGDNYSDSPNNAKHEVISGNIN